jgi:hypothetical protein
MEHWLVDRYAEGPVPVIEGKVETNE